MVNELPNQEKPTLRSAIFRGWVQHRRFTPHDHQFRYPVFMMYLDLAELESVFRLSRFWSLERWNLASFRRRDYFLAGRSGKGEPQATEPGVDTTVNVKEEGGRTPAPSLDAQVRAFVKAETGELPEGPIRMLTNLRYFGFVFNPLTCYYVFNQQEQLSYVVAEVTNTPWGERHAYVLPCDPSQQQHRISFDKNMHVSPFNPMNMQYKWHNNTPADSLNIHMENWCKSEKHFDASLCLKRQEISSKALVHILWQFPLMTVQVVWRIYWQALKLWWKKTPIYRHPKHSKALSEPDNNKSGSTL